MKKAILTYAGFFLVFILNAQVSLQEKQILLDLYTATDGQNWTNKWDLQEPVEKWHGITVEDGKVTEISLLFNNLNGTLPSSLGNLGYLRKLELSFNSISGGIPAGLGNLKELEVLAINGANLQGNIPAELGNLINLKQLHLSSNQLSGSIPLSLGYLPEIEVFNVFDNQLEGEVPIQLSYGVHLKQLMVAKNNFTNPNAFSKELLSNSGATLNLNEKSPQIKSPKPIIAVEREDSDD
ncbi:MAG: hypothetical protein WBA61_16775 [Aequorivita sp.]